MSDLPDGRAVISRRADQRGSNSQVATNRYVALGSQTEQDFGLFDYTLAAQSAGASPHYHQHFSESFYVLEGELTVLNGNEWVAAGAGDLVYVPRSSVHGFRNDRDETTRFLIVFTPGAPREKYFDALAALRESGAEMSSDVIDELARQHDQINVR